MKHPAMMAAALSIYAQWKSGAHISRTHLKSLLNYFETREGVNRTQSINGNLHSKMKLLYSLSGQDAF